MPGLILRLRIHGGALRPLRAEGRGGAATSVIRIRCCTTCAVSRCPHGPIDLGEGAEIADPIKPAPVTVLGFDEAVQVLARRRDVLVGVDADVVEVVMGAPSCRWTSRSIAASGPSWHRASVPRCSNGGKRTSLPSS